MPEVSALRASPEDDGPVGGLQPAVKAERFRDGPGFRPARAGAGIFLNTL